MINIRVKHLVAALIFGALPCALVTSIAAQPADMSGADVDASAQQAGSAFTQQDLDQLLAPIALYPDALLAQILMASTYPLEVVMAGRWQNANPNVKGQALEDAMQQQDWDPSVKSLTAVPRVLQQMNDHLDWVQKLGDAFSAQNDAVMATIQKLRARAYAAGNLKSTSQVQVSTEMMPDVSGEETIYVIDSTDPNVMYVPIYNPYLIYGPWWYPAYPPYYVYPSNYAYPSGIGFFAGILVGAAIWGHPDWHHHRMGIDVARYNRFNRSHITNNNWVHNVAHNKGVGQHNPRGFAPVKEQSHEQFRGREEHINNNAKQSGKTEQLTTKPTPRLHHEQETNVKAGYKPVGGSSGGKHEQEKPKGQETPKGKPNGNAGHGNAGHGEEKPKDEKDKHH